MREQNGACRAFLRHFMLYSPAVFPYVHTNASLTHPFISPFLAARAREQASLNGEDVYFLKVRDVLATFE